MITQHPKTRLGIIGGLGALAGVDVYFKLVRSLAREGISEDYELFFEQHPFDGNENSGGEKPNLNARKLYIFDMIRQFEKHHVESVLVPCFISHTFIRELQTEITTPIVSIMDALRFHLKEQFAGACHIGVLASDYVKSKKLFENTFSGGDITLSYPDDAIQTDCVMHAIYGDQGIKAGNLRGAAVDLLHQACVHLLDRGADVIVSGATDIAIVADLLRSRGIPIVDTNQVYVDYALRNREKPLPRSFKIGVVGGVGPAATVDFMNKIIHNTSASRDQDHIKIIVEHNPKIPDRTANLIGDGEDPTIALYAACKRLEDNDAALIAIPCNTAHAYVKRIQAHLAIPIVNMLDETVAYIRQQFAAGVKVGLLATSGTIASRVYHEAADGQAFELLVPDDIHQARVMHAIYGEEGIKAGYTDGTCRDDLMAALLHLVQRGATVIVLGCTELPLLLKQDLAFPVAGSHIALLDPTTILARSCVARSDISSQQHGSVMLVS
ncbi:aspartate/glutamate racemase family protein [Undibacterium sp. CY18W]|uniref:Aspartate/glutamate racemase family protein n=1 Tax=Undibacterium hunanense TaxID=2762292 RepID=A0ABR6ZP85_9BURK|nr:amino acid racemase [Undibacterium hunanense]MBC3917690.1 aspartate/glutamate racemase family protein [Undibacterium hunanense]